MKKLSLVLMLVLGVMGFAMAQRTISGTVTDEKGEPLIGASILVKGTTSGTVTDVDGKYSLQAPAEGMLVVSYTGFTTKEVALGPSNAVDIALEESAEQLSEVVVTAIGISREKKALGYAVSDLGSDDLAQRSEPDPVRAIAGKTPGVLVQGGGGMPGQSTKINIRGNSSLTGNTQPLFVVDGIPFDNSVNASTGATGGTQFSNRAFDIDPNNIESMTILKGAAAAALYGSRATNGVVVITTKTGAKKRKGLEVTFNSSFQLEQISGIPDYQNVYGQGANQVYNGGFIGNWGAPFASEVDRINSTYGTDYSSTISYYSAGGQTYAYPDGTVPHPLVSTGYAAPRYSSVFPEFFEDDPNVPGAKRPVPVPYTYHDNVENFFGDGRLWENSLSINAGGDNSSISATVSRMDNKGIVPNAESSRTTLSFGGTSRLSNGFVVSGNVNYVNTAQSNPPINGSIFESGWYGGAAEGSIFARLFYLPRNYNLIDYPFENPVDGSNVFYRALDDPRWLSKYNRYSSALNRVFGNITLSYDVTPWLNLTAKGGVNTYSEARRNNVRPGGVADPNGAVWTDDLTNTEVDFNYIATVTTDITEDIDIRALVGLNHNQRDFNRRFVTGDNVISTGLYTLDGTSTQIVGNDFRRKQRLYALYADVQLGFKDYLYVGLVGRNDWSSTLPKSSQSYFYGGGNVSFVFTDAFDLSGKILSSGKVRAAYTQVGNEARPYQTSTVYFLNTPFTTAGGSVLNQASLGNRLGNADLRNELTTEIEFGADLRFLNNRIGLDLTYFKRSSTDQITETAVPATSGFRSAIINAGEIENKGFEIGLDLTPVKTAGGFTWNTFINYTRIRTEVIDAGEGGELFVGGVYSGLGTIHRNGFPYGQIFGVANARTNSFDADGNYIGEGELLIDKNLGTTIYLPESQIIGNPNPDFLMGFVNTFTFKNITLRALIDWRQGGDIFSISAGALMARGHLKITENREELRVIPGVYGDPRTFEPVTDENGNFIRNTTAITAFDFYFSNGFGPYGADETIVFDGTTIRLREVSLGYDLPKKILDKTPFGSLRLSVSGRNLWFKAPNFLEGLNFDPEVLAETADSNVQGFEYGSAPTTRRYGVNLSVTF
ncbi:MAG: SusC/RagA family TonB-linked outer membrane protein [Saprospiraceae bacterium]|jgi:TonB-linked SusC/RagA family outer membrane protein|nr:SusC/RagA family TonB-linked outer membrane protein [Saprospiraceae bacterium]